jgi:hypothetical protein
MLHVRAWVLKRPRLTPTATVAWALIAWCVACLLLGVVVLMRSLAVALPETIWAFRGQDAIIAGATAFVGGLLALKRPENLVSWLMLTSGAVGALGFLGGEYAIAAIATPAPGDALAAWLGGITWIPTTALLFETGLLFPNGVLVSSRWRYAVLAVALGSAATFLFFALYPGRLQQLPYDNPFGLAAPGEVFAAASTPVATLFSLGAILAVISLVLRYRTSGGEVRQQLKWLVVAGSFAAITDFLAIVFNVKVLQVLALIGIVAFLISMALAILKYRLYEIDIIIRRTLVYGATTASIAAAFFAGIVVLQQVLRPLTSGSELAVAASTLTSFALFQPVRRRVQDVVDRRFDRSRYDAMRMLDAFADRLRDEVNLDALRAELLGSVQQTMSPAHMSLWLRERVS